MVVSYHMSYRLARTSMALDPGTIKALKDLSEQWGISKAEVMRRAVRKAKEEADREVKLPKPVQALDWLQGGGGLSTEAAAVLREEVSAERHAKRYWWEA